MRVKEFNMKKLLLSSVVLLSTVFITACTQKQETSSVKPNQKSETAVKQKNTTASSKHTSSDSNTQTITAGTGTDGKSIYPAAAYKNLPLDLSDKGFIIKSITKGTGSLTGKPIIEMEVTFTNKSKMNQSPYMAFVIDFDVQQTDGQTTQSLLGANGEMGNFGNQDLVKMGDTQVNPGATVDAIIGFQLDDESKDVGFVLRSSQFNGNPQGFAWHNQ